MSNRRQRSTQASLRKKKQRQLQIYMAIGGAIVVIIAIAIIISQSGSIDVPIPDDMEGRYAGITQAKSAEGYPQLGNPDAPIEVREYSSFGCPHCRDMHEEEIIPLLNYVRSGDVKLVFVPISTIGTGGEETARAGSCALDQGNFWEMHDVMFHWQGLVSITEKRLKEAMGELDMDKDEFDDCYNSSQTDQFLSMAVADFSQRGLTGTPSVYVDGQKFENWGILYETIRDRVENQPAES